MELVVANPQQRICNDRAEYNRSGRDAPRFTFFRGTNSSEHLAETVVRLTVGKRNSSLKGSSESQVAWLLPLLLSRAPQLAQVCEVRCAGPVDERPRTRCSDSDLWGSVQELKYPYVQHTHNYPKALELV